MMKDTSSTQSWVEAENKSWEENQKFCCRFLFWSMASKIGCLKEKENTKAETI